MQLYSMFLPSWLIQQEVVEPHKPLFIDRGLPKMNLTKKPPPTPTAAFMWTLSS